MCEPGPCVWELIFNRRSSQRAAFPVFLLGVRILGWGIRKKKLICQVLRFLRLTCCRLCDPKKWAAAAAARQPSLIMMRPRRPVRKIPFRYKFVPSCRNFYLKWVKGKIQHTVKEPIYTGSWKHAPFPQEAAARSSLDVKEK